MWYDHPPSNLTETFSKLPVSTGRFAIAVRFCHCLKGIRNRFLTFARTKYGYSEVGDSYTTVSAV